MRRVNASLHKVIAAEVTSTLVQRVLGKKAAGAMVRRIPVAGGVYAAGTDAYATRQIGKYAGRELRPRGESAQPRRRILR